MSRPSDDRGRLDRAQRAIQRGYVSTAAIAIAALILMTAGHDAGIGWVVLAIDAVMVVALFAARRAVNREIRRLDG